MTARCERVASRQFSDWAWEWIREDFVGDLVSQLANTVRKDDFELRGAAGAYVDTAIRNLCRRYFRDVAQARRQVPLDAVNDRPASGVRDSLAQVAMVVDLKRALQQLSPACRNLIRSKYVLGETLDEIGRGLGVPEKTARSRLHTCRQKLRQLLWGTST